MVIEEVVCISVGGSRQRLIINSTERQLLNWMFCFFSRIWNQLYGAGERVSSVIARSGGATQHKTLLCQPLIDYSCIQ